MTYDVALILVGLVLVAKGGDLFVDASIYIGKAFGIARVIIGGTLVSLATTTPELVVSALASSAGDSGIALGNAVGSCICNVGLIVGTLALLTPVEVERRAVIATHRSSVSPVSRVTDMVTDAARRAASHCTLPCSHMFARRGGRADIGHTYVPMAVLALRRCPCGPEDF